MGASPRSFSRVTEFRPSRGGSGVHEKGPCKRTRVLPYRRRRASERDMERERLHLHTVNSKHMHTCAATVLTERTSMTRRSIPFMQRECHMIYLERDFEG